MATYLIQGGDVEIDRKTMRLESAVVVDHEKNEKSPCYAERIIFIRGNNDIFITTCAHKNHVNPYGIYLSAFSPSIPPA